VHAAKAGSDYVDVGTLGGYRAAIQLLDRMGADAAPRGRDSQFIEKLLEGNRARHLEHAGAQQ
jgi:hypothetical protein